MVLQGLVSDLHPMQVCVHVAALISWWMLLCVVVVMVPEG
jgi:hypothetical protein